VANVAPLPPRYERARLVARGGMGDIYVARDRELARVVAVKVLAERFAADTALRERFRREALAAARLSGHPHIVTIFDVGEQGGRPFIVMEHLPGGTLGDRVEQGLVSLRQSLEWLAEAASALDAAHAEGIVHRDVKPANLLVDADERLRVADFGIARVLDDNVALTLTGTILGTAGYLSPEQARGRAATAASDVYSLAVVGFELLTGGRPFERQNATAEAEAHANNPVPRATDRDPRLPTAANQVFERALAKNPADRHVGAGAFVTDLRDAVAPQEEPTRLLVPPGEPQSFPGTSGAPAQRRPRWAPIALASLLLAGGGIAAAAFTVANGNEPDVQTLVRRQTVTTAGKPVERNVTVTQTVQVEPPAPPAAPSAGADGSRLNLEGYRLQQQGRYSQALPLLQQAVTGLAGTYRSDFPDEAYANYNLGYTLLQLGRCSESLTYLDRSEQLQGHRDEIDSAREQAEQCLGTRASPGKDEGKGKGKGKDGDRGDGN
jgi:hypothetical protein